MGVRRPLLTVVAMEILLHNAAGSLASFQHGVVQEPFCLDLSFYQEFSSSLPFECGVTATQLSALPFP